MWQTYVCHHPTAQEPRCGDATPPWTPTRSEQAYGTVTAAYVQTTVRLHVETKRLLEALTRLLT